MVKRNAPLIDMTLDGNIIAPARPSVGTVVARLAAFGIGLLILAIAFWAALFMVPVLIVLGILGYLAARAQSRRNGNFVQRL